MFNTKKSNEIKKFTGLTACKVLAINPEISWLIDNGFRKEGSEDIDYNYSFGDENSGLKVSFFVQSLDNDAVKGNIDFLVGDAGKLSKTGKKMFVDVFGKSTYSEKAEDCKYLDQESIFHGNQGIQNLIKFIRTWTRSEYDVTLGLSLEKIIKGDISEIKTLLAQAEEAEKDSGFVVGIKLLFGINEKGYTTIYNRNFVRIDSTNYSYLLKDIVDEYNAFKADFQGTLEFKEYNGTSDLTVKSTITTTPDTEEEEDDLPF